MIWHIGHTSNGISSLLYPWAFFRPFWPFFYVETNAISTETTRDLRGVTSSQGHSLERNITAARVIYVRRGVIDLQKRLPPSAAVRNIENFYAQIQAADSLVAFFQARTLHPHI